MTHQIACDEILPYLQAPTSIADIRVVELEIGHQIEYGVGNVRINPWLDPQNKEQMLACDLDEQISLGIPLSLVLALRGHLPDALQAAALDWLLHLVNHSLVACNQLNRTGVLPLATKPHLLSKKASELASEVESACKLALGESYEKKNCEWTQWATSYEVWLRNEIGRTTKICLGGVAKSLGVFDMNGAHLTGGRLWAGALLLARWLASLTSSSGIQLGAGPILEMGAGIGLVGISLAKLGYRVVLSDREPMLLEALGENIKLNQVEDNSRVLDLNWEDVEKPKVRRKLSAQRFSAVVGSDLIYYGGKEHAELVANVLRQALPCGGVAFFAQPIHHRKYPNVLGNVLTDFGFDVTEGVVKCTGIMQDAFCGDWEPNQEYAMYAVRISPNTTELEL